MYSLVIAGFAVAFQLTKKWVLPVAYLGASVAFCLLTLGVGLGKSREDIALIAGIGGSFGIPLRIVAIVMSFYALSLWKRYSKENELGNAEVKKIVI